MRSLCAQVLLDVARSLEHVHRMSLLHCDLKPANVRLLF
jgi:serine/threonine protein kinase